MTLGPFNVSVLGAGSWGTTLANLLAENDHNVTLWDRDAERAAAIAASRKNPRYLPGVELAESIDVTSDLHDAADGCMMFVFAVPSHAVRETAERLAATGKAERDAMAVNTAKGIEERSLLRMSEVLASELPFAKRNLLSLVGPSHAEEVSRGVPTSVVVAGPDQSVCKTVRDAFTRPYFRVYTNSDVVGVEIGVALKNPIAVAAGIIDGLGYGDNTKAALITRGIAEISRLAKALGGEEKTISGLAGVGDLVVTCLSRHSRNRHVGEAIGRGRSLDSVLAEMTMVAEGVRTTRAAVELAAKYDVELPIIEMVQRVLFDGVGARDAIDELMSRPPRMEMPESRSSGASGGNR